MLSIRITHSYIRIHTILCTKSKTEQEFIDEILALNQELEQLNAEAHNLETIISHNIKQIATDNI